MSLWLRKKNKQNHVEHICFHNKKKIFNDARDVL